MMWFFLILAAIIAIPMVNEVTRRRMNDAARVTAPGQFAELSNGVTHFEWYGPAHGTVVVCVHGLTTPSFVWRSIARGLALMGFRVLTYDLYGRGYSDRPQGNQDAAFFLSQLQDLLEHEAVDGQITLIGYSMGGAIATYYAAAHPGRVRQLVLLAPAGMGVVAGKMGKFIAQTPIIGDWLMLALYPGTLRKGIRAEQGMPTSVPEIGTLQEAELDYKRFIPSVLASIRGILPRPLREEHEVLHAHGMPVLAIWGKDDSVIPLSAVDALAGWNPDAHQEIIEGAGHGLTYTHTDQILEVFQDVLIHN